jgi:hypothetical protein
LISLRADVRRQRGTEVAGEEDMDMSPTPQYMSQYLGDSSVAADISQFDFGTSVREAVS